MIAKICDRCRKHYECYGANDHKRPNGIKTVAFDDDNRYYYSIKEYDLCPDCMKKLQMFMKEAQSDRGD